MVLFVDACVRADSRTRELASALLKKLGPYETVSIYEEDLPQLNRSSLQKRDFDEAQRNFEDPYFRYAKQFAQADEIVIAAPFWDLSFPARLRLYLETVCIVGLTFRYGDKGRPIGLCKAKKLSYVTTAGGPIGEDPYGFGYVKALCQNLLGIDEVSFYKAEKLDVVGNDPAAIIEEAKKLI